MSEKYCYADDLTLDYCGFCNLWKYIGSHLVTYGQPPHYRKTADFLASGGIFNISHKTTD